MRKSAAENEFSNKNKIATIGAPVGERSVREIATLVCLCGCLVRVRSSQLLFFIVLHGILYEDSKCVVFLESTFLQCSRNTRVPNY